jgi:hypothetical protein
LSCFSLTVTTAGIAFNKIDISVSRHHPFHLKEEEKHGANPKNCHYRGDVLAGCMRPGLTFADDGDIDLLYPAEIVPFH